MARLLHCPSPVLETRPGWAHAERVPGVFRTPQATGELGVALHAERCAVSELLEIAKNVLTLDIAFEPRASDDGIAPASKDPSRLAVPVVLKSGQVYGTLWCPDDDCRTAIGNRVTDALRTVAVLVSHEVDRHRRMTF